LVRSAQVKREAAIITQFLMSQASKLTEPRDIIGLRAVTVILFALQRERRTGHYQAEAVIWQFLEQLERIATVTLTKRCAIRRKLGMNQAIRCIHGRSLHQQVLLIVCRLKSITH
jgi:hypothetical protein